MVASATAVFSRSSLASDSPRSFTVPATRASARRSLPGSLASVNVSSLQLSHPDFVSHVGRSLQAAEMKPSQLTLEVTESVLMNGIENAVSTLTALRQMDPEFETVSASLKQPFYRTFWRVTVPVCLPSTLDIAIYMFVNAMTTVSGVVFIYGPQTELASISVLNMDDTGEIASAAAMAMMIFYTNVAARMLHLLLARSLERRTQAWRRR